MKNLIILIIVTFVSNLGFGQINDSKENLKIEYINLEVIDKFSHFPEVEMTLNIIEEDCQKISDKNGLKKIYDNNNYELTFEIINKYGNKNLILKKMIILIEGDSVFAGFLKEENNFDLKSNVNSYSTASGWSSWSFYARECKKCTFNKKKRLIDIYRRERNHWLWGYQVQYDRWYYNCGTCN